MTLFPTESGAYFSPCKKYRYSLWRIWDKSLKPAVFIGLNPSTADETIDDPTIRRCIGFAKSWNMGGLYMLNLFAFRATDPKVMKVAREPIGPVNDASILDVTKNSGITIAAWGIHGEFRDRDYDVCHMLAHAQRTLHCLGLTKKGKPRHPLYLKKTTEPSLWNPFR